MYITVLIIFLIYTYYSFYTYGEIEIIQEKKKDIWIYFIYNYRVFFTPNEQFSFVDVLEFNNLVAGRAVFDDSNNCASYQISRDCQAIIDIPSSDVGVQQSIKSFII